MSDRIVNRIIEGLRIRGGGGVTLSRLLGTPQLTYLDPFLLLDEFRSEAPDGDDPLFPAHPHRGFETVTYLKQGRFRHQDSKVEDYLALNATMSNATEAAE